MRGPVLETLAILAGAGMLLAAAPLDSIAGSLFATLGLALGVAGTATWWVTAGAEPERRWEAFAVRAGLVWTGRGMQGRWAGRAVRIEMVGSRVELRTPLADALEPFFPVTTEGLVSHLASIESGSALPVPSLRRVRTRLALREALAAGVPIRASGDQLMATLERKELDETGLETCLRALTGAAASMDGGQSLPGFWKRAA